MKKTSKIYVAGHKGLVGSAITRNLLSKGYNNIVFCEHADLDLTNQKDVRSFFENENPEYVILAAAKVGGIDFNNTFRADFIYENIMIQSNVIHQCYLSGIKKLLFLGSTCVYPRDTCQPILESSLLTGELEYTNEPYAIAKISGIKMCESYNLQYGTNFISVMPTNLYGPFDNFNFQSSHVLPALLRKMHLGKCLNMNDWKSIRIDLDRTPIKGINGGSSEKDILTILNQHGIEKEEIEIWGSGKPKRDFLFSEDMADACVFILENIDFKHTFEDSLLDIKNTHINIGTGVEISIKDLCYKVKSEVGYTGNLKFNLLKNDGTMRKLTDTSKLNTLGWKYSTSITKGIKKLYSWYLS